MILPTDNPLRDFYRHEAEQERELAKLPKCDGCKEPIQDDYLYEINGELLCERCMNDLYRRDTDGYINE